MSWIRPRDHNLFVNLGSLTLCGLLAGVVVAAAFFPSVAMGGLLAKESLEQFDQLPTELTVREGPQITYVYASDGTTLLTAMYDENRRNITLDEIGENMVNAIIAAEDKSFYEHNGVDTRGIARAFVANIAADQVTQGASTITQQFVRLSLTYFSTDLQDVVDATEETTARKLREVRMAIAVEKQFTKDQIIERYLNLAYFGEGAYGIFAASQVYFGKPPAELEVHEAALLAGMVQAPSQFNPAAEESEGPAYQRRNWVIDQMVDTGAITAGEAAEARTTPMEVEPERPSNMCVGVATNHWGFFCDYFYRWWLEQEAFGATSWEREQRLRSGGYHIVTTLDLDVQETTKDHVEAQLATGSNQPHALMLAAVEPGTGKIRAMATNRNYRLDDPDDPQNGPHTDPRLREQGLRGSYPNTVNPLISGGGDIFGYQAGSTFKLFTMLAALEDGLPLNTRINSPARVTTGFYSTPGTPAACGDRWCPVNYPGQAPGSYNMWTAFGSSINTYFVQLVERVGPDKAVDVAARMGIQFRASGTEEEPLDAQYAQEPRSSSWGPFTLGVSATTPLDLAVAYATVSAEGIHCDPLPVEEIRTPDGDSLDLAAPNCERALDRDIALAAIDAGRCVTGTGSRLGGCGAGSGTASGARGAVGKPVWGKTGTSDGTKTYTTVLSTKQLTVAGQMADPDWGETTAEMTTYSVRDAVINTLRDAMDGRESQDWASPTDEDLIRGPEVNIPEIRCLSIGDAEARLRGDGFRTQIDNNPVDSDCAPGQVARTTPSGVTSPGDTIILHISNGSDFETSPPSPGGNNGGGNNGGGNNGDEDDGGGGGGGGGGSSEPPPPEEPVPPTDPPLTAPDPSPDG